MQQDDAHTVQRSRVALVIDDEDHITDLIATVLIQEGFQVYVAHNGRDGLRHARTTQADIVIVDIMMPYLNGEQLIDTLRETDAYRETPVVLISAASPPLKTWPRTAFLPKPFDIDQLLAAVRMFVPRAADESP